MPTASLRHPGGVTPRRRRRGRGAASASAGPVLANQLHARGDGARAALCRRDDAPAAGAGNVIRPGNVVDPVECMHPCSTLGASFRDQNLIYGNFLAVLFQRFMKSFSVKSSNLHAGSGIEEMRHLPGFHSLGGSTASGS